MAQLGWLAGPLAMLFFALITLLSTFLLCDSYRSPDPEYGPARNRSYLEAVYVNLGKRNAGVCGLFVQISLFGTGIAYTITSTISMRAIQKSNCYYLELSKLYHLRYPTSTILRWLSILAAFMSFTYSSIGFVLGLAKVVGDGYVKGSMGGIASSSAAEKVWLVSQAIGDIAFAYPYSLILIEIQDTLKSPPPENQTMKKASTIAITVTTFFYLCCGGFGYAAFGDAMPGNLLTGFGFYEPYWLVDFANACIVLHLVGGYQNADFLLHCCIYLCLEVFSQPLFANVEKWFAEKFPGSRFVNDGHTLKLPLLPDIRLNLFRLCFRSVYVVLTTGTAMIFPYFNQVLGVHGSLIFWPLSVYFPVGMYFKQRNIQACTTKWVMLRTFSIFCLLLSLFALIGSIQGLLSAKLS